MDKHAANGVRFDPIQSSAERLLSEHFSAHVTITSAVLLTEPERRNRIWRCGVELQNGKTSQIIVKQLAAENYNPDDIESYDTKRFFRDWAGAAFISEAEDKQLGPRFYGGDRQNGFILLEDLGEHRSLVEPLLEGDRASATRALLSYASQLGKLHAYGYNKEHRFDAILQTLNKKLAEPEKDALHEHQWVDAKIDHINNALPDSDFRIEGAAREEAHQVFSRVHHPILFRTFIHGDPCPDNVFYDGAALRFIDFEFSRYWHALHDALYGFIPFPTCWCCNRVISEVLAEMQHVYRNLFGSVCKPVLDDALYYPEVAALAGYWAITSLDWLENQLKEDSRWGIAGNRARIITRLNTFIDASSAFGNYAALQETSRRIRTHLARIWGNSEALPFYPAFRSQ